MVSQIDTNISSFINTVTDVVTGAVTDIASFIQSEATTIQHRQRSDVPKSLVAELGLRGAPNREAYFQALAQNVSWVDYANGTLLAASDTPGIPRYRVQKTLQYPEGLKAMIVTSDTPGEAPLMIIRGTVVNNVHNVIDDLHYNIGTLNMDRHGRELARELELLAAEHGRVHVLGHSYGGAIAQHLTSRHPQLISRCSSYNAPGVGDNIVDTYFRNVARLPEGYPLPEIVSVRHAKDVVSLLGGEHLPESPGRAYTGGSVDDGISYIDAHSYNTLSTGAPHSTTDYRSHDYLRPVASSAERLREGVSRIMPLVASII